MLIAGDGRHHFSHRDLSSRVNDRLRACRKLNRKSGRTTTNDFDWMSTSFFDIDLVVYLDDAVHISKLCLENLFQI